MQMTEKAGNLLTAYSKCRDDLSIDEVVDIMYSGFECFKPEENLEMLTYTEIYAALTKEWAVGILTSYEARRQKIPSDEKIAEVAGDVFSVEEMKKWALKAVCHFYRCHSADRILLQLGLLVQANDGEGFVATDVCELSVWEWFGV